jgi:8-oxo-dGTP diphosphatase
VSPTTDPDHFDFVRTWFAAFNRSDREALVGLYAIEALVEQAGGVIEGRLAIAESFAQYFGDWEGALDGGARRRVRTIGRMEAGWIHAEWVGRERRRNSGELVDAAGYDRFLVDRGRIVRHVTHISDPTLIASRPESPRLSRHYPDRPIVGVGGIIVRGGEVVLIRRRFEPLKGHWSLPGGTLELGEMLEAAVAREMFEETGLVVDVGPVVEVFDRITLDDDRRVRYHFVLVDYLCRPIGGALAHGSDVDAAVFVPAERLPDYGVTPKVRAVVGRALEMNREHRWQESAR